ncbi:hypothetical protein M427DRAFT_59745, partial [Gonapodya prolifera JEL478]
MRNSWVQVDLEPRHQRSEKYPLFHPRSQPIPSPWPLQPEEPLTVSPLLTSTF